jgi:anti-anti-sigma factor
MPSVPRWRNVADVGATPPIEPPAFRIAVTAGAGRVCLWLRGELDLCGAAQLDRLADLVCRAQLPCTVDCSGVTFVDASGIGALLRACARGCSVCQVPHRVRRLLELLDLTDQILGRPSVAA